MTEEPKTDLPAIFLPAIFLPALKTCSIKPCRLNRSPGETAFSMNSCEGMLSFATNLTRCFHPTAKWGAFCSIPREKLRQPPQDREGWAKIASG